MVDQILILPHSRVVDHLSGPLNFYIGYRRERTFLHCDSIWSVHSINQDFGEYGEVDNANKLQKNRDRNKEGKGHMTKLHGWIDSNDANE